MTGAPHPSTHDRIDRPVAGRYVLGGPTEGIALRGHTPKRAGAVAPPVRHPVAAGHVAGVNARCGLERFAHCQAGEVVLGPHAIVRGDEFGAHPREVEVGPGGTRSSSPLMRRRCHAGECDDRHCGGRGEHGISKAPRQAHHAGMVRLNPGRPSTLSPTGARQLRWPRPDSPIIMKRWGRIRDERPTRRDANPGGVQ